MLSKESPPTIITEGSQSQGSLSFFAKAYIFGTVEGEVLQQSLEPIIIGRTGWVHGSISSQGPVVISGKVNGNIYSATLIQLQPTAEVTGTLVAPALDVQGGASFNGETVMRTMKNREEGLKHAA